MTTPLSLLGGPYRSPLFGRFVELCGDRVRYHGQKFRLDNPSIDTALKCRFLFGTYERPEIAAIRHELLPDVPVVELGAAIGVVSCITSARLHPTVPHIVVEPNPGLIGTLEANRAINHHDFTIINAALGYASQSIDVQLHENFLSSSVVTDTGKVVSVPSITLRRIIADFQLDTLTVIADVEGAEIDMVKHEADVLSRHVTMIIMETHPTIVGGDAVRSLLNELRRLGFEVVRRELPSVWPWRRKRFAAGVGETTQNGVMVFRNRRHEIVTPTPSVPS